MSEIRRVSPQDAQNLLDQEGYTCVDVRSVQEFEAGHPAGAFNVPWKHQTPAGMQPNPDFAEVMAAHFPKDAKLVLTCRSGGRSLAAAQVLAAAGYSSLVDQRAGFVGAGEPGWSPAGLPTEEGDGGDRSYAALVKKLSS